MLHPNKLLLYKNILSALYARAKERQKFVQSLTIAQRKEFGYNLESSLQSMIQICLLHFRIPDDQRLSEEMRILNSES